MSSKLLKIMTSVAAILFVGWGIVSLVTGGVSLVKSDAKHEITETILQNKIEANEHEIKNVKKATDVSGSILTESELDFSSRLQSYYSDKNRTFREDDTTNMPSDTKEIETIGVGHIAPKTSQDESVLQSPTSLPTKASNVLLCDSPIAIYDETGSQILAWECPDGN